MKKKLFSIGFKKNRLLFFAVPNTPKPVPPNDRDPVDDATFDRQVQKREGLWTNEKEDGYQKLVKQEANKAEEKARKLENKLNKADKPIDAGAEEIEHASTPEQLLNERKKLEQKRIGMEVFFNSRQAPGNYTSYDPHNMRPAQMVIDAIDAELVFLAAHPELDSERVIVTKDKQRVTMHISQRLKQKRSNFVLRKVLKPKEEKRKFLEKYYRENDTTKDGAKRVVDAIDLEIDVLTVLGETDHKRAGHDRSHLQYLKEHKNKFLELAGMKVQKEIEPVTTKGMENIRREYEVAEKASNKIKLGTKNQPEDDFDVGDRYTQGDNSWGYVPMLKKLITKSNEGWFEGAEDEAAEAKMLQRVAQETDSNLSKLGVALAGCEDKNSPDYLKMQTFYSSRCAEFAKLLIQIDDDYEHSGLQEANPKYDKVAVLDQKEIIERSQKYAAAALENMPTDKALTKLEEWMHEIDWEMNTAGSERKAQLTGFVNAAKAGISARLSADKSELVKKPENKEEYRKNCLRVSKLFSGNGDTDIDNAHIDTAFASSMAREAFGEEAMIVSYNNSKEQKPKRIEIPMEKKLESMKNDKNWQSLIPEDAKSNPQVKAMLDVLKTEAKTPTEMASHYAVIRTIEMVMKGKSGNIEGELQHLLYGPLNTAAFQFRQYLDGTAIAGARSTSEINKATGEKLSATQKEAYGLLCDVEGYGWSIEDNKMYIAGTTTKVISSIAVGALTAWATGGLSLIAALAAGGAAMTATNALLNNEWNGKDLTIDFAINATGLGVAKKLFAIRTLYEAGNITAANAIKEVSKQAANGGIKGFKAIQAAIANKQITNKEALKRIFDALAKKAGTEVTEESAKGAGKEVAKQAGKEVAKAGSTQAEQAALGVRLAAATAESATDLTVSVGMDMGLKGQKFSDALLANAVAAGFGYAEFMGPVLKGLRNCSTATFNGAKKACENSTAAWKRFSDTCKQKRIDAAEARRQYNAGKQGLDPAVLAALKEVEESGASLKSALDSVVKESDAGTSSVEVPVSTTPLNRGNLEATKRRAVDAIETDKNIFTSAEHIAARKKAHSEYRNTIDKELLPALNKLEDDAIDLNVRIQSAQNRGSDKLPELKRAKQAVDKELIRLSNEHNRITALYEADLRSIDEKFKPETPDTVSGRPADTPLSQSDIDIARRHAKEATQVDIENKLPAAHASAREVLHTTYQKNIGPIEIEVQRIEARRAELDERIRSAEDSQAENIQQLKNEREDIDATLISLGKKFDVFTSKYKADLRRVDRPFDGEAPQSTAGRTPGPNTGNSPQVKPIPPGNVPTNWTSGRNRPQHVGDVVPAAAPTKPVSSAEPDGRQKIESETTSSLPKQSTKPTTPEVDPNTIDTTFEMLPSGIRSKVTPQEGKIFDELAKTAGPAKEKWNEIVELAKKVGLTLPPYADIGGKVRIKDGYGKTSIYNNFNDYVRNRLFHSSDATSKRLRQAAKELKEVHWDAFLKNRFMEQNAKGLDISINGEKWFTTRETGSFAEEIVLQKPGSSDTKTLTWEQFADIFRANLIEKYGS